MFINGDVLPRKDAYFKYGSMNENDWNPAEMVSAIAIVSVHAQLRRFHLTDPFFAQHMFQTTPVLVSIKGRVHFAWLHEQDRPLRYPGEILAQVMRSAASFRYGHIACVFFDIKSGAILQQNAASFPYVEEKETTHARTHACSLPLPRLPLPFPLCTY